MKLKYHLTKELILKYADGSGKYLLFMFTRIINLLVTLAALPFVILFLIVLLILAIIGFIVDTAQTFYYLAFLQTQTPRLKHGGGQIQ